HADLNRGREVSGRDGDDLTVGVDHEGGRLGAEEDGAGRREIGAADGDRGPAVGAAAAAGKAADAGGGGGGEGEAGVRVDRRSASGGADDDVPVAGDVSGSRGGDFAVAVDHEVRR